MSIADKNLDDSMPPTVARDARGADVDVTAEGESLVPDVPASPPETTQPAPVAPPSEQEKREIKIAQKRVVGRRRPARAKVQSKRYGSRSFSSPHTDIAGFRVRLADALGTASAEFVESSLHQLIQAVSHCDMPEGGSEMELNAALALIESIRPTNEVQAALGLQMAATHRLAMVMMGQLRRNMTRSNATVYGGLATKLLRAFAAQFEVLDRLRRGGQQTVRVEHVTVQAGGQAIVGHVETTGGGGLKSEEQPHAIAHAPGVEMPSPNPERSTMPSASDAERPVPTARGDVARRSEG
ncbi:MAG TPA: hypothetical protein VFC29_24065 [Candidatus Limnocylindrales bacterium]|nr:hypothetical protein [Candidatus Limnocylindrales bacterium]